MRTTKKELIEMLENYGDNQEIILRVRGNSSTDYSLEQRITVAQNNNFEIIIHDSNSYYEDI